MWDADGRRYLDFYGGHCVTLLGHCPPRVVRAVQQQAATLLFYSNVIYSDVRARAAELLAPLGTERAWECFFLQFGHGGCGNGTQDRTQSYWPGQSHCDAG